ASPPPFIDVLKAPEGEPRTKPRALNFALDFAKGDIVGIYDAEDRPPPDQIRKIVDAFASAPPEVACIQARLGYYNTEENWLTRCFEVEYSSWFDVMLPGLHRLAMPLPLGGTSLFVRRRALDAVGGWDSHNVTEDADLGMVLARRGFRTALCDTLTEEEASSRPGAWIRQRSRWLKGYLATWTTHMRRPGALWRDLGPAGFLGFNAVLLSAALGYLALPLLWLAVVFAAALTEAGPAAAHGLQVLGVVSVGALPVLAAAALLGLRRRGRLGLWPVVLTAPFYWILGAAAAYLAAWELATAPTKWRKTRHGVGRIAAKMRRDAAAPMEKPLCESPTSRLSGPDPS
ncbi:MAG: glycosyltransferase family 2 protein, partial [Pseudomonadota bacterium]